MREIVEATEGTSKRPKKIRFSQIDTAQIRIAGQEPGDGSSDMLSGDFKIKDVTRVQYFAANRLVDGTFWHTFSGLAIWGGGGVHNRMA